MSDSSQTNLSTSGGFSFKLSKNKRIATSSNVLHHDNETPQHDKDYILSVEDNQLNSVVPKPRPKEYIIPLIKTNNWRVPEGGVKGQATPTSNKSNNDELKLTTPTNNDDKDITQLATEAILEDVAAGLFLDKEQKREGGGGGGGKGEGLIIPLMMKNKPPVQLEDDKLNDLPFRPDESSLSDYTDMPIEHYGSAMLKGMGWKPGQPIGLNKKGLIDPIEYIAHPGGLGLGATPRPPDPKKKTKIKKPGEIEVKRPLPYKDKDGRVKHVKKIGEEIPQPKPEGFSAGNYARVTEGPHEALYGKILAVDEKNQTVTLRLAINNEDLRFQRDHLEVVSEVEFKKYGRIVYNKRRSSSPPSKQYGLIKTSNSSSSSHYHDDNSGDMKREELPLRKRQVEDDRGGKEEEQSYGHVKRKKKEEEKDTIKNNKKREEEEKELKKRKRKEDEESDRKKKSKYTDTQKTHKSSNEKKTRKSNKNSWIASNLRVRIIDKEYMRGIYYNKKVHIIDVIDLDTCVCQSDEGKLLEGINQDMLETVIPKNADSSSVMIVSGDMKGRLANIVERNSSRYQALVQVIQTTEFLTLNYDDMCEYRTYG